MTNNYYRYIDSYSNPSITHIKYFTDIDEMLTVVSQLICFSDCVDIDIIEIVVNGRQVRHPSWKPLMTFEYKYADDNTVLWKKAFPEWTH